MWIQLNSFFFFNIQWLIIIIKKATDWTHYTVFMFGGKKKKWEANDSLKIQTSLSKIKVF